MKKHLDFYCLNYLVLKMIYMKSRSLTVFHIIPQLIGLIVYMFSIIIYKIITIQFLVSNRQVLGFKPSSSWFQTIKFLVSNQQVLGFKPSSSWFQTIKFLVSNHLVLGFKPSSSWFQIIKFLVSTHLFLGFKPSSSWFQTIKFLV